MDLEFGVSFGNTSCKDVCLPYLKGNSPLKHKGPTYTFGKIIIIKKTRDETTRHRESREYFS